MGKTDTCHGGEDSGAVSGNTKEKDLTLMISQYMSERFRELGVPVVMTRITDETVDPTERVNRILNAFGDKPNVVVISNHINSNTTGTSEGAEVIYALRNDDTLAQNILNALGEAGQKTRLVYQRRLPSDTSKDYYFIHRNTGTTEPVIVEYGFINNAADLNRIKSNYREYVDAVVDAVIATEMGGSIPPTGTTTYTVKSGDSLYKIAQKYNTTVDAIKQLNGLTSNNLSVGQILLIPSEFTGGGGTTNTYTVQSGDSLWSIAGKFNTTVNEIKRLNNLTSDNLSIGQVLVVSEKAGSTTPTEPSNTYTVQSGDSLWSIARKFDTTVDELKRINNLTSNNLRIGQVLQLPSAMLEQPSEGGIYTVQSGDSLWSIARKFNTTVNEIKRLNSLTSDNLSIGQVLRIPNYGGSSQNITYTVKSGDSLYKIAQTYNTTVDEIKRLNNLMTNSLTIGQVLQIPRS